MTTELITQVTLYPDGMDPDGVDAGVFAVIVKYCGPYQAKKGGGYSVEHLGNSLARKSRKWEHVWRKDFRRWQYRWPDLDSALEAAREVVNTVQVNGRTWAEYQAWR